MGKKQSSKELTQDLRDASGLSVDPSPVRRSLNRNGLSEKGGCQQFTQRLDFKLVATSLMEQLRSGER